MAEGNMSVASPSPPLATLSGENICPKMDCRPLAGAGFLLIPSWEGISDTAQLLKFKKKKKKDQCKIEQKCFDKKIRKLMHLNVYNQKEHGRG